MRADIPAASGFPQRADVDRPDRHSALDGYRGVPAKLADCVDLRRAAGERLLPVAAIHGVQHDRLCRCAASPDEHGDQLLYNVPADVADAWHCDLSGDAGSVRASARSPGTDAYRLF